MSLFENCKHETITDGICLSCGLEIEESRIDMTCSYSNLHPHSDGSNVQPFENDLRSLSIPDEIKNLVIKLALSCSKETHRMGVRRQQLFAYIYFAYLQLGYIFDPDRIMEELKMSKRETNMALRIISGTSSSEISLPIMNEEGDTLSAPVVVFSPIQYIEDFCKENNLLHLCEDIKIHSKKVLEKNEFLFEEKPKHIAVVLIKHFLRHNDINIPKFAKNNGVSESIVKKHMVKIVF